MKILSINAGSSSLKFQMYEMPKENVLISGVFERIGMEGSFYTIKVNGEKIRKEKRLDDHEDAVNTLIQDLFEHSVINKLEDIEGIGHRVVHGGDKYSSSAVIDHNVIDTIKELCDLAPLHNPANLLAIEAFKNSLPEVTQVAVFDTSFQQTMKEVDYLYPIPYEWCKDYGVRKYGFHGISHNYISNRLMEILDKKDAKIITCHLGNGCSIEAIKDGKCIDASLGFSPNSGLMMGTRCGEVDTGVIPFVMKKTDKTLEEVMSDLTKKSGFLGISGISSDSRDIEEGIKEGNARCKLAQDIFIKRCVEYIAKFYVLLEGVDGICFAAGLGENSIETRKQILNKLAILGVKIDEEANNIRGEERLITTKDSSIPCYIIPTDEEVMIAKDTYSFIK